MHYDGVRRILQQGIAPTEQDLRALKSNHVHCILSPCASQQAQETPGAFSHALVQFVSMYLSLVLV